MNAGFHINETYLDSDLRSRCANQKSDFRQKRRTSGFFPNSVVFNNMSTKSNMCSIVFVIVIIFAVLVGHSYGFNLDVKTRVEFEGTNRGSYYGYSVALMDRGSQKLVVIGAPKDNSTYMPNTASSGAVYTCTVLPEGQGHTCGELYVDDDSKGNTTDSADYNGKNRVYINGRDGQLLGIALDVHKDVGVVTCASRWYNRYYESEHYFFMNGLCYQIPVDLNRDNIIKIPGLVDASKQTTQFPGNVTKINYGMGNLGASVHYTKQGQDLLLGSPGLRTWTGGFIDIRRNKGYITEYLRPATEISELAGYAMTSGNYFGNGQTYFAIGAPREELTGKVFVYRGGQDKFVYENTDAVLDGSESPQVGYMPVNAFFGSALGTEDVNNDGIDDLLVGAPFFVKGSFGEDYSYEEGIVIVYLGQSNFRFQVQAEPLVGSKMPGARFGSAISSLGDINKDKYNDIIIGAPYEDDMQGAVYVYNGCKTGVWPKYSQRIPGSEMANGLKSFGISLSRPVDMNDDDVNDIAIGAYLSDAAFLLYGQSVINIDVTLGTAVDLIDKDSSVKCTTKEGSAVRCFAVEVCFDYYNRLYGTVDITYDVRLDTYMEGFSRLVWLETGTMANSGRLRIFSGSKQTCTDLLYAVIKSTTDLVTPVRITANYKLDYIPTANYVTPTLNQFSGSSPDKDLMEANLLIEFKKKCPDNRCKTNLQVQADLIYDKLDEENYFIIGTPDLFIHVDITKTGDPSYGSNMFITMPNTLQYKNVVQIRGSTEVSCDFVEEADSILAGGESDPTGQEQSYINLYIPEKADDELMLICSFGNPLFNDTGVKFHIQFVVPESITNSELKFHLNATTLSTETAPSDNEETLTVNVKNKVSTSFLGVSRPSYITVDDNSAIYHADHIFELRNQGPSPLPSAKLTIQYPQIQAGGQAHLYLNKTTWSCEKPCEVVCSFPDHENAPIIYSENVGPTYYVNESPSKDRVAESRQLSDIRNVDCTRTTCSRYECQLTNIPPRESAVVSLEFVVNGAVLQSYSEDQVLTMRSDAFVRFDEQSRLLSPATEHFTDVLTDIFPLSPPAKSVAWWIILISVLGGVILILLIIFILWKCGFFKRKQMEQMKMMQHEGEVEKMVPTEDDCEKKG